MICQACHYNKLIISHAIRKNMPLLARNTKIPKWSHHRRHHTIPGFWLASSWSGSFWPAATFSNGPKTWSCLNFLGNWTKPHMINNGTWDHDVLGQHWRLGSVFTTALRGTQSRPCSLSRPIWIGTKAANFNLNNKQTLRYRDSKSTIITLRGTWNRPDFL